MKAPTLALVTRTFAALALSMYTHHAIGASLTTSDGPVTVNNWGYQLQGPPPGGELLAGPIAEAPHDLIVIDFARYGDTGSLLTSAEVAAIKTRNGTRRRVAAAYVSIGEAGDFRSFWDPAWTADGSADSALQPGAPGYLGPVNPDFPESRKVRYWDPTWRDVIFNDAGNGWLDTVVDQGFDAAYLDIVDAYYFWGEQATAAEKVAGDPDDAQDAARRMIDFIVDMTAHARQTNPDFFVIPQNGAFILNDADFAGPLSEDAARRAAFLDAVGAIGVEDVYFPGDNDENNAFDPDDDTIAILRDDFLANGKPVFAVDYLNDADKVDTFLAEALAEGFIPYAAPDRDLDQLGPPVPEPTALLTLAVLGLTLCRTRAAG